MLYCMAKSILVIKYLPGSKRRNVEKDVTCYTIYVIELCFKNSSSHVDFLISFYTDSFE